MRCILLIYQDEDEGADRTAPGHALPFDAAARRAGVFVAGHVLRPGTTATCVRVRHGAIHLSDGPAADTGLTLAGCYVLDVADERDAIRWAARIPAAKTGAVEVRRVAKQWTVTVGAWYIMPLRACGLDGYSRASSRRPAPPPHRRSSHSSSSSACGSRSSPQPAK
jgi:hypothetical protein